MSINICAKCGDIYDTDYHMEEINDEMVCDECYEEWIEESEMLCLDCNEPIDGLHEDEQLCVWCHVRRMDDLPDSW